MRKILSTQRPGIELTMVLIIMGMVTAISLALLQLVSSQNVLSNREIRQQQIAQIAEAGINYYRWHLAHYPSDYKDGTATAGPYVHDFKDSTSKTIGRYELTITAPATGSTIATVRSSAYLLTQPNARHTVTAKLGIPSLSKYAVVANANMRFGAGTETFGPIHSNGGIHYDGIAHGLVSSAQTTYTDPDGYGTKSGVWSLNSDAVTFLGGKQVGVPPIDFAGITVDLAKLQTAAQSTGIYLAPSTKLGYHLTLKTNGTVDMKIVKVEQSCQFKSGTQWYTYGYCSNNYNNTCTQSSDCGSGNSCITSTHSVGTKVSSPAQATDDEVSFTYNGGSSLGVTLPANGIIFASDNVWVDGTINNARITIAAAKDPLASGKADIYLNKDLKYTNYNGQDVVGLIAQNDVLAGYFSNDTLQIDAAIIAQNGRVGRPYFGSNFTSSVSSGNFRITPSGENNPSGTSTCQEYRKRTTLTLNGSLATNQRYGFAWTGNATFSCGGGLTNDSGYCTRNLNFDNNLVYAPPPLFPTSGEYSIISYTEQ